MHQAEPPDQESFIAATIAIQELIRLNPAKPAAHHLRDHISAVAAEFAEGRNEAWQQLIPLVPVIVEMLSNESHREFMFGAWERPGDIDIWIEFEQNFGEEAPAAEDAGADLISKLLSEHPTAAATITTCVQELLNGDAADRQRALKKYADALTQVALE